MAEPTGNLVTLVGVTTTGELRALLVDDDGRLQVVVD